jgi:hypothetical protein
MEYFKDHVSKCDGDISEKKIVKLTPGAKLKVADIIEKYFERQEE